MICYQVSHKPVNSIFLHFRSVPIPSILTRKYFTTLNLQRSLWDTPPSVSSKSSSTNLLKVQETPPAKKSQKKQPANETKQEKPGQKNTNTTEVQKAKGGKLVKTSKKKKAVIKIPPRDSPDKYDTGGDLDDSSRATLVEVFVSISRVIVLSGYFSRGFCLAQQSGYFSRGFYLAQQSGYFSRGFYLAQQSYRATLVEVFVSISRVIVLSGYFSRGFCLDQQNYCIVGLL